MSLKIAHIALIGCGKMGSAMLQSWANDTNIEKISVIDPHTDASAFAAHPHITIGKDASSLSAPLDAVILAVKPQMMNDVCTTLKPSIAPDTLILSIAAGKTIASFETIFGSAQPIIRTMPNTPAAIGKGITAICPSANVSAQQTTLAKHLLSVTGNVETVDDESLFNAITALSGSGPAYIFHMIETLETAGIEIGLPAELSKKLARQTVIGSAALAETEGSTEAATLRQNVTSSSGTTAAALDILMNGEVQALYTKALTAAKKRGEELN